MRYSPATENLTRFPFLAKTVFFLWFFRGPKKVLKMVPKMSSPWDPIGTPNGSQNASKLLQKGGPESGPKLGTPLGGQIVRFCCYLLYFGGVGPLRKESIWGTFLVPFCDPKWPKRGPKWHLKNSSENRSILGPFWVPFLEPLWEPRGQNKEHRQL